MGKYITDYFLYKNRYIIGYTAIGLAVIALLIVVGLFAPGGLTTREMSSVVKSASLSLDTFEPSTVVNLPYQVLQRLSIEAFGVSNLSIKLPSLALAAASIVGILLLLRRWFQGNVALLTTVIVIATGQLLFVAQSGTPSIMYLFTSVWLLLAALFVSRRVKWSGVWKIVLFAVAALSLYTPLSIYILIALTSAVILHPHLRYLVRRLSKVKVAVAALAALVILTPLIYSIVKEPQIVLTLMGIPKVMPDLWANFVRILNQYFNFVAPTNGEFATPIYGLGPMLLMVLGALRLVTTKYTARSYIITIWTILILPVLIMNPNFVSVTFIPIVLLMAMGIDILLGNWYKLFPRNPYARIAGLIPLSILIGGMVISGIGRSIQGHRYTPETMVLFSQDLTLVNRELNNKNRGSAVLVVDKSEAPFYGVVAKYHKDVALATSFTPDSRTIIMTRTAKQHASRFEFTRIVTNRANTDADRLYIYKSDQK
jgi:hypothetical protein